MPGSRVHVGSLLQWVLAAALIVAVIAVGSLALREARTVTAVLPISAESALPVLSASLPPHTVFLPLLLLTDGTEVRIGDSAAAVEARLKEHASMTGESQERSSSGERLVRFYQRDGTRFI